MTNTVNVMTDSKTTGRVKDNYSFYTRDRDEYLKELIELGAGRTSSTVKVKELFFSRLPEHCDADNFFSDPEIIRTALADSRRCGTKICLEDPYGNPVMLRGTALASVNDRLGISGTSLAKLDAQTLAQHLNDYAQVASGEGLMIFNNGKVDAIMGKDYRLVPVETVMTEVSSFFDMEDGTFMDGYVSHHSAHARWNMGIRTLDLPLSTGLTDVKFEQTVQVRSSDCGFYSIHVAPAMRAIGEKYGLNYTMSLSASHTGKTSIGTLRSNLNIIGKQLEASVKSIERLADTYLSYPANVLLSMYKWLKIPMKYGAPVYEAKKRQWGADGCSAYEVYGSLDEVLQLVMGEKQTLRDLAEWQERFARVLRGFHFED